MTSGKKIALIAGPVIGLLLTWWLQSQGLPSKAYCTAGISCWVAIWWVFEPIPVPATAIIPFACFPLAGVMPYNQVAAAYGHHLVLLMMGGFMISLSMETSGAHRRLALGMVRAVGSRGGRTSYWASCLHPPR